MRERENMTRKGISTFVFNQFPLIKPASENSLIRYVAAVVKHFFAEEYKRKAVHWTRVVLVLKL